MPARTTGGGIEGREARGKRGQGNGRSRVPLYSIDMDEDASLLPEEDAAASSSTHPCRCLEQSVKAFLGCLGLDSIFSDHHPVPAPAAEDEKKDTERGSSPSAPPTREASVFFTILAAIRRPRRPVVNPGSGGQNN
ncbi:hypothetical protein ACLOJK_016112 [Asimina triloba]